MIKFQRRHQNSNTALVMVLVQDFLALAEKPQTKSDTICHQRNLPRLAVLESERDLLLKSLNWNIVSPIHHYYHYFLESSPSPDTYNIPTVFKPNNTTTTFSVHCKGENTYCFGTGREAFNKTVVVNRDKIPADPINPGPAVNYHP